MKLNELKEYDEDVYQKVYSRWSERLFMDDWYECVYESMKEKGKEQGFEVDDIEFSGFWSQGDGARWKGSIDVYKWLQGQEWWKGHAHWSIYGELVRCNSMSKPHTRMQNSRSCHWGSMNVYINWDELDFDYNEVTVVDEGLFQGLKLSEAWEIIAPHTQDIEDTLLEAARDFAREIYRALEKEYEYQTSEEAFADWAEANEIEFDEEGEWA